MAAGEAVSASEKLRALQPFSLTYKPTARRAGDQRRAFTTCPSRRSWRWWRQRSERNKNSGMSFRRRVLDELGILPSEDFAPHEGWAEGEALADALAALDEALR